MKRFFNEEQHKILDLGLKYVPDTELDKFEACIENEYKKMPQKKIIEATRYKHSNLRNNFTFNPKMQQHLSLVVLKQMVEDNIRKIKVNRSNGNNIWKTIKEIEKKKKTSPYVQPVRGRACYPQQKGL